MEIFKLNFSAILCGFALWLGGMVTPVAAATIDLDTVDRADGTKISILLSRPVTDRVTRNSKVRATLTNISAGTIVGPIHVVIDQLSPTSAIVIGAGDISTTGKSIYTIPSTELAPGGVATVDMEFANIGRNVLVIGAQVYIQPPAQAPPPAPVVTIQSPLDGALFDAGPITVTGSLDREATVSVNGVEATVTDLAFSVSVPLSEGSNAITATATNAGGEGQDAINVILDTTPPTISIGSPANLAVLNSTTLTVTGPVSGADSVTVNGVSAAINSGSFSANITLVEGANSITATAVDAAGNSASDSIDVTVELAGSVILGINISSPAEGAEVSNSPVTVTGIASPATVTVKVNGLSAPVASDGSFSIGVPLTVGSNAITAVASRAGSDPASDTVNVTLLASGDVTSPVVVITNPLTGADFTFSPIPVTGTVDDNTAEVTVNGVNALVVNGTFSATVPLIEGANQLAATATDPADNVGTDLISVNLNTEGVDDTEPPEATIESPSNNAVVTSSPITVTGFINDGLAVATLNGVSVPSGDFELEVALVEGQNLLTLTATDPAGNTTNTSIVVTLNTSGVDDIPPVVEITDPLDNDIVQTPSLAVQGTVNDDTATVVVNGVEAVRGAGDSWATNVPLSEGANLVTAVATDTAGNTSTDDISVTLDTIAPVVNILSPADGSDTESGSITVSGTVDDDSAVVVVNGVTAVVSAGTFSAENVNLSPGENFLNARATDAVGNEGRDSTSVNLIGGSSGDLGDPLAINITSPGTLALVRVPMVDIEGTVDELAEKVIVNGVEAVINGTTYSAADVPLREGQNLIAAIATSVTENRQGTSTIQLSLDTTPPIVRINAPPDGAKLTSTQTTVVGIVNDLVGGPVNEEKISVEINGRTATVLNGSFEVRDLLLVRGINTLRAVARDIAGNESFHEIQVEVLDATGQQRIVMVSGNNQTGLSSSELPKPLVVELQDADGRVLPDRIVNFSVVRSDGVLSALPQEGEQIVQVVTDEFGQASALFTLGTRTGAGNNQVAVSSQGFVGDVIFCESSLPGDPVNIVATMGNNQRGVGGQPLPVPFQVLVTDMFGNPVAETDVEFSVIEGSGSFAGELAVSLPTDLDGKASILFTPGEQSGVNNNLAVANIAGLVEPVVNFLSSSVFADLAAAENTSFSGVVLDMGEVPIPGTTVQIIGEPGLVTTTDEDGRFIITGVPVGVIHLLVDGSTSPRQEAEEILFTFLAFMATTISGQDNTIGMPIQIPAIDQESAKIVGGDEDVVLTMKGVSGVEYTVFANSASLPNGDKYVGPLMLTQIPADRVPMPPPDGSAPTLFSTLQPANIHFDPPVRMQLPNVEGLSPGQVIEIFSFDHDLEEFISVGPGTVTADGAFLVSDPGFGIVKSGWHGASPPPPPPICKVLCDDKNECTRDGKLPSPACGCTHENLGTTDPDNQINCGGSPGKNSCTDNGFCFNGTCIGDDKPDGTSCDDGLKCFEKSTCSSGVCTKGEPKDVSQPIPTKITFDMQRLRQLLTAVEKVSAVVGVAKAPPPPAINFEIERTNECCEQKDGATTRETKLSGTMVLKKWEFGPIPLGAPPWVFNYDIPGTDITIAAGAFVNFGIGLSVGLSRTSNECVDQVCWAGTAKLTAEIGLELKVEVDNPFTTSPCERDRFDSDGIKLPDPEIVDCALLLISGEAKTGLSGIGTVDCVKLALELRHEGFSIELKFILFEGSIIPSFTQVWSPLPAQTLGTTFVALPQ